MLLLLLLLPNTGVVFLLSNENEGVGADPPKTGAVDGAAAAVVTEPLPIPPNALVVDGTTAGPVENAENVVDLLTGAAVVFDVPDSKENNEGTGAVVGAVDVPFELLPNANGALTGAEVAGRREGVGSLDGVLPNENMEVFTTATGAGAAALMGTAVGAAFDDPKEKVATGILLGCVDIGAAAPKAGIAAAGCWAVCGGDLENENIPGIEDFVVSMELTGAGNAVKVAAAGVGKDVVAGIDVTVVDVGNLKPSAD